MGDGADHSFKAIDPKNDIDALFECAQGPKCHFSIRKPEPEKSAGAPTPTLAPPEPRRDGVDAIPIRPDRQRGQSVDVQPSKGPETKLPEKQVRKADERPPVAPYPLPDTKIVAGPDNRDPDWKRYRGPHPDSMTPTWDAQHKANVARVAEAKKYGDLDIVLFGDSISQGLVENGDFDRFGPRAADFGIKNDNTEHLRWRMLHGETDFGDHPPKQAVIFIGANSMEPNGPDARDGDARAVINITNTVELAQRRMPNTEIIVIGVLPQYGPETIQRVDRVNAQVAKSVANIPNVRYVDIGDRFLNNKGVRDPALWSGGLHPSPEGYGVLADAIEELLNQKNARAR